MHIRPFCQQDVSEILAAYKEAFEGFPWNQTLGEELVARVWADHSSKSGFACIVGTVEDFVVAMAWWDTPSLEELREERGDELAAFAHRHGAPPRPIVWEREVLVRPAHQGHGFGREIRIQAHESIRRAYTDALVLTRMRDDNTPILSIGAKIGFVRTGIRMPSRNVNTSHEYWVLNVTHG